MGQASNKEVNQIKHQHQLIKQLLIEYDSYSWAQHIYHYYKSHPFRIENPKQVQQNIYNTHQVSRQISLEVNESSDSMIQDLKKQIDNEDCSFQNGAYRNNSFIVPKPMPEDLTQLQQILRQISYYKNLTSYISYQINHKGTIYYHIKQSFYNSIKAYEFELNSSKSSPFKVTKLYNNAIQETKAFIAFYLSFLTITFDLNNSSVHYNQSLKQEDLRHFVISEIFNADLTCLLLEMQRILDRAIETDLQKKMASDLFQETSVSQQSISTEITESYNEAIEVLKSIQFQNSPVHKLKVIVKAASLLKSNSNQLYINLILNSHVATLNSQINFICHFVEIQNTLPGYYTSMLKIALSYISNLDYQ